VGLEVDFRTYRAKDGAKHTSLRIVSYKREFGKPAFGAAYTRATPPSVCDWNPRPSVPALYRAEADVWPNFLARV
jgi:hypothetical protein